MRVRVLALLALTLGLSPVRATGFITTTGLPRVMLDKAGWGGLAGFGLHTAIAALLVGTVRKANAGLVKELVPTVLALSEVQKVLQNLLQEKVSIRNLALILEVLADGARQTRDAGHLTELVRQRLGATICQALLGKGNELAVLTLDPSIEPSIATSLRNVDEKSTLVLEPRYAEQVLARMAAQVEKMVKSNLMPVLVCAPQLRRHLRVLTERVLPQLSIVSMAEIPPHLALRAFGMVTL